MAFIIVIVRESNEYIFKCCLYWSFYLKGASVKPFGSFVSILYAKSGDLDVSIDVRSGSGLPINKKKKQDALGELMRALQNRGKFIDLFLNR
jgi:DNA polymerase sigma